MRYALMDEYEYGVWMLLDCLLRIYQHWFGARSVYEHLGYHGVVHHDIGQQ